MLPWWLEYHRKVFDHGIVIDYHSTDRSLEIVREMCPTWTILSSRNKTFATLPVDQEVCDVEKTIQRGWKCTLTVTEYLLGDFTTLQDDQPPTIKYAPVIAMVDDQSHREFAPYDRPLYEQFTMGLPIDRSVKFYYWRGFHNQATIPYRPGRHFVFLEPDQYPPYEFIVLKYIFAPMTRETLKRKLQIQYRIPSSDIRAHLGHHHHASGTGNDSARHIHLHHLRRLLSSDQKDLINKYLHI